MQAGGGGLQRAFPDHLDARLAGLAHVAGLDRLARLRLEALGPAGPFADELVVHLGLLTLNLELVVLVVAGRQAAEPARGVAHDELVGDHAVGARVAETGDRVVVPQDAVVAAGHDQRNADVDIVLGQLNVVALVVHDALLVLTQAVEGLVRRAFPDLARGQEAVVALLVLDGDGVQLAAARPLLQHLLAVLVQETDGAGLTRDLGRRLGGLQHHEVTVGLDLERGGGRGLGRDHQAGGQIEVRVLGRGDADRLGAIDLKPDAAGGALGRGDDDAAGGALERGLLQGAGRGGVHQAGPAGAGSQGGGQQGGQKQAAGEGRDHGGRSLYSCGGQ